MRVCFITTHRFNSHFLCRYTYFFPFLSSQELDDELSDQFASANGSDIETDDVDKKIHRFENLLARLQSVVTQMEAAEKEVKVFFFVLHGT